ncbi:MAG: hypothetical protein K0S08_2000 [Gammaproteobacteria bacterium]|nr:hypothetical protein [Gammaproteobacteria bacterium]
MSITRLTKSILVGMFISISIKFCYATEEKDVCQCDKAIASVKWKYSDKKFSQLKMLCKNIKQDAAPYKSCKDFADASKKDSKLLEKYKAILQVKASSDLSYNPTQLYSGVCSPGCKVCSGLAEGFLTSIILAGLGAFIEGICIAAGCPSIVVCDSGNV